MKIIDMVINSRRSGTDSANKNVFDFFVASFIYGVQKLMENC